MKRTARASTSILAVVSLLALAVLAAGCSLLPGGDAEDFTTITENSGLFHIKIPSGWSGQSEDGLVAVASTEDMPADVDTIDRFWLLVYPSAQASETPLAEELPFLVEARAEARAWQDAEFGQVETTTIGSRDAVMLEASGSNVDGVAFDGRYYLVRTQGHDIIVTAIAPAGTLDDYVDELDAILTERWFWHGEDTPSDEPTTTETP